MHDCLCPTFRPCDVLQHSHTARPALPWRLAPGVASQHRCLLNEHQRAGCCCPVRVSPQVLADNGIIYFVDQVMIPGDLCANFGDYHNWQCCGGCDGCGRAEQGADCWDRCRVVHCIDGMLPRPGSSRFSGAPAARSPAGARRRARRRGRTRRACRRRRRRRRGPGREEGRQRRWAGRRSSSTRRAPSTARRAAAASRAATARSGASESSCGLNREDWPRPAGKSARVRF